MDRRAAARIKNLPPGAEEREADWFEIYRELREELRSTKGLPADYNPVAEMAKLGMRTDIGPALRFLCHREVASYTHRRLPQVAPGQGTLLEANPAGEFTGALQKLLSGPERKST
jgi:hypothetical protein